MSTRRTPLCARDGMADDGRDITLQQIVDILLELYPQPLPLDW